MLSEVVLGLLTFSRNHLLTLPRNRVLTLNRNQVLTLTGFSNKLRCPGYFVQYDPSGDQKRNMGLLLANTFMSAVAKGMFGEGIAIRVRKISSQIRNNLSRKAI
jgi:hypothetical protein